MSIDCRDVSKLMRVVLVAAAFPVVVASCGNPSRPSVGAPPCEASQLSVAFRPNLGVALGNRHGTVAVRNNSTTVCTVGGYLELRLRDASKHLQATHVHDGGTYFERDRGPHAVILAPGDRAVADVAWGINPSGDEPSPDCEPRSRGLEVSLPDVGKRAIVRFGEPVCRHGDISTDALHKP